MKKLLLFLMFLASTAYAIDSSVVGTMLKQEGTKILPADDVTELDVSGIICTGCGGGVSEGADVTFGKISTTDQIKAPEFLMTTVGDDTKGYCLGDGDTCLYEFVDDNLYLYFGGKDRYSLSTQRFASLATGSFYLKALIGSATIPIYGFIGDINTGLGRAGADQLSHIAGGVEAMRNYTAFTEFYPSGVGQVRIDDKGSIAADGAVAFSGISTITADYVIGTFEDDPIWFIECDAALGNISTTLPPVADKKGRLLGIKLMSAANGCYLDGNGAETIDGAAGQVITTRYNVINLIAGSSEWLIGW